jgi:KipI family sensor histidine kinase inhibitor
MTLTSFGPDAWLFRFAVAADEAAFGMARRLAAGLGQSPLPGLVEGVLAFTTLLLRFEAGRAPTSAALRPIVEGWLAGEVPAGTARHVELPVLYAGADLARVAEHSGLPVAEVIARHVAATYRVHCLGFAPGFPYLGGLDPRLHTPRLASPRPRVPAGSVAIGGEHAGVYSLASPGGWNLLGRTKEILFEPRADSLETMFRLRTGDTVRFRPESELPPAGAIETARIASATTPRLGLRILSAGVGLGPQDLGRPGFARFGVPPGGAMDPAAAAWANRLLDNPVAATVLELCLQGQRLEVLGDGWLAVTGSAAPRGHGRNSAFRVRTGDVLEFGPGLAGVWTCLAIPGGWDGPALLGSRSANPRAGIGHSGRAGDVLAAAGETGLRLPPSVAARRLPWGEDGDFGRPVSMRVWPGPQWDSFSASDRERFFRGEWNVSSQCDRVGYRLTGAPLRPEPAQIISEPVLPGSIQVPANGQPIVTMPDGPTIGGYPKLGLVDPADLARLAQCRPGQNVRFRPVG